VDTTLLGHFIPKGTMIVMTTNTHYEDESHPTHTIGPIAGEAPRLYDPINEKTEKPTDQSPEDEKYSRKTGVWAAGTGRQFDPDRWLREDGSFDPNAGPSLPFSLGQRGCFGKSLAVSQLRLYLANKSVDGIKDVLFGSESSFLPSTRRSLPEEFPEERDCYFSSCLLLCTTRRLVVVPLKVPHPECHMYISDTTMTRLVHRKQ
jgi:hypothetical protein